MALRGYQLGKFPGVAAEDAAHHLGEPPGLEVILFFIAVSIVRVSFEYNLVIFCLLISWSFVCSFVRLFACLLVFNRFDNFDRFDRSTAVIFSIAAY